MGVFDMNTATEDFRDKIGALEDAVINKKTGLLEAFGQYNSLTNDLWWAEQGEKLDNAYDSVKDGLQSFKDGATEKYNAASQAISDWFNEMKDKMSVAWGEFKEYAGHKMGNFKEAMQQFGEKMSEMWGKAMESLGKLFDEIKIGAHDAFVDVKTGMQNLCTDMSYVPANLCIAVQKGVLAMDDAFQQVKGGVSQAVADQFNKSAGQLLVESKSASQDLLSTKSKFSDMDFTGQDPKTIVSAKKHQDAVLDKMGQEQEKLTAKMESRENFRDTFQGIKDGATQNVQTNIGKREDLNVKSGVNTGKKQAVKVDRSAKAKDQKSSYADKVRDSRATPSTGKGL
jgi:hypothetical protein